MNLRLARSKGFTLVELIVVIAIIAILTSVLLPSFTQFIDRGRFSNDVQKAASMTTVIKGASIGTDQAFDANDIRRVITEYHGTSFDFTPSASNTGFFYIEASKTIIASKYENVDESLTQLKSIRTQLLSESLLDQEPLFHSPDEFFGEGIHLLTTDGSSIAIAVDFVYQLANSGSMIQSSYDLGLETLEQFNSQTVFGKLIALFGYGLSDALEDTLASFVDYYDPAQTLYVNNVSWATNASNGDAIKSIVFARDIINIPTYGKTLSGITLDKVTLPKTVKTIDQNAFSADFTISTLEITSNEEVQANPLAFSGVQMVTQSYVPFDRDDPTFEIVSDDPEEILIAYDPVTVLNTLSLDLSDLNLYFEEQGIVVVSYNVVIDLFNISGSKVYIYSENGYLGYVIPVEIEYTESD